MNNNKWFDEHIKEQLGDYAPDVHPRIWENIAANKKKRKPVGFWYSILNSRNILLIAGILLAGGSGAWFLLRHSSGPDNTKNEPAAVTLQKTGTNPESSAMAKNDPATASNIINNTTGNTISPVSQTTGSLSANEPVTMANRVSTGAVSSIRVQQGTIQPDDNGNPGVNRKKKENTAVTANPGNDNRQDETAADDQLPATGSLMGRLVYGVQKISAERKENGTLKNPLVAFGFLPDCPAFEKNASGNKKYVEIYGGPDFAIRSMSDTGNSVYLQKRKETTKVSSAYSAGIRYTKVFNNSMSVRAGVNYSQINEKFTFVQGNLVQVTYIINANGDTTGSYITTGTRYKTTYNKYRSVDVPLLVGYELGNGRIHANINAGPVINVYSWQKGEVLDTSLQPVSITTGKGTSPYQFKTNAGVGFMGAVSVYYKLTDKTHIMAEPYFRYNLSQLNKENLTLKQKYNTVGIRVGVRVDLK